MKRVFDIVVVVVSAVCWLPLVAVVGVLVGSGIGFPILFRQQRPGLNDRPFKLFKFRTMTNARDGAGNLLPDQQRLTAFGRFLRASSLDELPELFNVLKGEMSLVGPRPLLMEYLPLYTPEQARRHEVKPGITGWAQINGRNAISWEEKFKLDVWYVEHGTLWLDLKILALTLVQVFQRKDINATGHATMPAFTGSLPEKAESRHWES